MSVRIEHVRAEDVQPDDIERHITGQGRLTEWRRVAGSTKEGQFLSFQYEKGTSTLGSGARCLDLCEVQRDV